jgi:predicted nicotinamide N-methyase
VAVETTAEDMLDGGPGAASVVLAGDLFYERALATRMLVFLDACRAAGASVLVGDPQRAYFPKDRFEAVAEYRVPVTRELEDAEIKHAAVWRLRA